MRFYTYPQESLPSLKSYVMLAIDAPLLTKEDAHKGLFLLDGTWRYAARMHNNVLGLNAVERRSLPEHYRTAYPREQEDCEDPERGLASVEALYLAYFILERSVKGLFDNYYWADKFLQINFK